ncbi:hypothetical protein IMZ11_35175 [Microtetraspora sp. AC03309]|uniref:hypothetical protein n=1 Tax=Microtetraspora sp. AC03309 TaxID=2779376 RepID=UPI001E5D66A2|nr:hypothetical protein [Microtetraspora sp. AC03309]MCC5580869.1 hypothetical protein [Microtetraspora sp. AC03309]
MLAALLTACGGVSTDRDAADIVSELAARGLPAALTVTYTEENDPNKLLGRPNGYTSKAAFTHERAAGAGGKPGDINLGGGVEVFQDADAAQTRANYIQTLAKASPMLGEYTYQVGNVVLRISKDLPPTDAQAYETALSKIVQ